MAQVYNKSRLQVENATIKQCPKYKGNCYSMSHQTFEDLACDICNGFGKVWVSLSGWTRAKYRKLENSKLY